MTPEWFRWYSTLDQYPYESLSLDYDDRRFFRLYVTGIVEEMRRQRIKNAWAAWARYRAGGELSTWTA